MRMKTLRFGSWLVGLTFLVVLSMTVFSVFGQNPDPQVNFAAAGATAASTKPAPPPVEEVNEDPLGGCPTITPTMTVQTVMGSHGPGGFRDWCFSVTGLVRHEFSTCPPEGTADYDTIIDVRTGDGSTILASVDDSPGCGLLSRLSWTPTSAGNYRVRVRGFADTSGTFTLGYRTFAPSPWLTNPPIPVLEGLGQTTTATVGEKIYIIGGGIGTSLTPSNRVWAYDPTDITYEAKAPLPITPGLRSYGAAAVYNNKIYVFGGLNGTSPVNTLLIYDTTTDTWSMGAPMPGPRFGPAVAAFGQYIYVCGGFAGAMVGDETNTNWLYDAETNMYTTLASMPSSLGRIHGAPYTTETVMEMHVFAGGFGGTNHLVYNVLTNTWRLAPQMPIGVTDPAAITRGDKIYVLGGTGVGRTQIFDLIAGTWSQGPDMPGPLDNTSGDLFIGQGPILYVFGGFNGSSIISSSYALHIE